MQLRIRIREQLCILVAVTSLLALMVLSLSTGIISLRNSNSVRGPEADSAVLHADCRRSKTLSVSANLKATQVSQILQLYKDLSLSIATRNALQKALDEYGDGNHTSASELELELSDALAGGVDDNLLLQAAIYSPNGPASQNQSAVVKVTGEQTMRQVPLPFYSSNGSRVYLGDPNNGYPAQLYPNLTWSAGSDNTTVVTFNNHTLDNSTAILLGPLFLDNSSAIMSMTIAIDNNTNPAEILGWLTVILDASLFYGIVANSTDLESAGEVLLVGPLANDNLFLPTVRQEVAAGDQNIDVRFVFQPSMPSRHPERAANPGLPFPISAYPAVGDAYTEANADSHLSSHNEAGKRISCGYAQVVSDLADWVVIFEASRAEVMEPIYKLRNTILFCIFSVFAAIIVICFPLAHYAVKPIRALKSATENSIMMYEAEVPDTSSGSTTDPESLKSPEKANGAILEKFRPARRPKMQRRRQFQIPERVPDRKHLIHNELTDLTTTFNEMSDELKVQYARLEDRVKKRTAELEKSRDLARAADESKTLFIANVSHELRTPLNGIIGMCSVAMQEDDISRVRQSLNIIYKSSDLLARLLNDLLTFSRNSYGQQLSIEHGKFRLGDIGTQIISIFEKQAREKDINLRVVFQGVKSTNTPEADDSPEDVILANSDVGRMLMRADTKDLARGPADTGPLRDMTLLGDKNRILQVLMNLVSNSLKFTPEKGMVEVRIRCKGFIPEVFAEEGDKDSGTTVVNASEPSDRATPPRHERRSLNFDFEVEDTGPGVPEHLQQEIFKPFVQGDLALSRKHGGTGLGLAICTQLATLMGGRIHLKSTVDIGSTFTCTLPLRYSKEEVPSVAGSIAPGSRQPSINHSTLTSSAGFLSTRSTRSLARTGVKTQPQPARDSAFSGHSESQTQLENPRVLTLSHPNLAGGTEENKPRSAAWSLKSRLSRQLSPGTSPDKPQPIVSNVGDPGCHREPIDSGPENTLEEALPVTSTTAESATASPKPTLAPQTLDQAVSRFPDSHILVAEDNKVNQEVITRMLKLENFTNVTLAEDGLEAVKQIRSHIDSPSEDNISLVFMDIQMPNMDGCEATKQIREMGFEAPIVALTAFDHETNRDACKSVGMDDFVGKPVKRKALREILDKYLKKKEEE